MEVLLLKGKKEGNNENILFINNYIKDKEKNNLFTNNNNKFIAVK